MTVKKRITLLVAGTGLVASLVFSLAVFFEMVEQPFEMLDMELEAEAHRALSSDAQDSLLRVNEQVLRMERLVKDLLNLSALEVSTTIETQPVDLNRLLEDLAIDYRILSQSQNITIEVDLPRRLILSGDATTLKRLFSNLLDNAIKYNVANGWVKIIGNAPETDRTITVTNTGAGVAATDIEKVFHQFYRVEGSRSQRHGGSGLGLTIAKRIVELHGGKIKIESLQGVWTRVSVGLPLGRKTVSA